MNDNIINFFQSINKGYIHPKGAKATRILLNELNPSDGEIILELGFGTGTSLVHTFSRNRSIQLFGVEANNLMREKASSRIRFCGLNGKITLSLLNENNQLPFPSDYFDKIYVESVLAIQEGEILVEMIRELKRVLKLNGRIFINELLWNPDVPIEKIRANNEFVKANFGIIQANDTYPFVSDWIDLFEKQHFTLKKSIDLNKEIDSIPGKRTINGILLRSKLFTLIGKLKSKLSGEKRATWKLMKSKMNSIDHQIKLDAYLLVFSLKSEVK